MFNRLKFSIQYALRNITRNRQRTAFALFSIAAGVATVVALRMLGIMLTDALTGNVKGILRGDIVVQTRASSPQVSFADTKNPDGALNAASIKTIDQWATANNIDTTYSLSSELMQAAVVTNGQGGRPAFLFGIFIDPQKYPFYDIIKAQQPAGKRLNELLTGPNQVVLGKRLADQIGAKVGDQVRVGAAKELQTVQGIVSDTSESNFDNPMSVLFSFVYLDRAYEEQFGVDPGSADKVYLRVPPNTDINQLSSQINREFPRPRKGGVWRIRTSDAVLKDNKVAADLISRFVLLLSLVALVIGGVGIVNTMLVSVNRRSSEIAVLKTIGLKGRSVGLLFLVESIVLGIFGSLVGLGIGVLLSFIAQQFGEQAFNVALPWRLTAEPLLLGMALGVAITIIFSIFPTFLASQVRPALVLRSGSIPLARAGCFTLLVSLVLILIGLSALSQAILGNLGDFVPARNTVQRQFVQLPYGVIGTLSVFVFIVVILALIWIVVWFLGKLPSFRNPTLRISIRALTLHRSRTALSLLALIIGMTALSGTLIMTRSINMLLATSISEPLGGNVITLPLLPLTDTLVHGQLGSAQGVDGYRDVRFANSDLRAINGDRNFHNKIVIPDDPQSELQAATLDRLIGVKDFGTPPHGKLVNGRFLTSEDEGTNHIVIPYQAALEALGVKVGSTFTYYLPEQRSERTFEIVGIMQPDTRTGLIPFSLGDSAVQAPIDAVPRSIPFDMIIANVKPDHLNEVMGAIGSVPGVFVFDVSVFDSIINRLLTQMSALPLLVAGLSLFAATTLIATTVSLATLERRRQIAILKAMGVKRQQALNQLLIENAIIGFAGGLISLLPTLLIFEAVPALTDGLVHLPLPADLVLLMIALAVGITLGATLLSAWGAANEKPLVALRYE